MLRTNTLTTMLILMGTVWAGDAVDQVPAPPLSESKRAELTKSLEKSLEDSMRLVQETPRSVAAYSRRGDAYFFLGRFKEAVADYDTMVELDDSLAASHWRRGIALFYAERYQDAAAQFESYHSFDQVDRENGIWRYLSQHKAHGRAKAREGLLKYQKDDREPFPAVYKLFAGTISPEQILADIGAAELSKMEREQRLFYAQLYIGLNSAVEGDDDQARAHLAEATRNTWGPVAGYGPTYMWHVGRLHEELLRTKKTHESPK
ncbi:tetratricopeptide repeat protein [Schlesneria paludicola]|uniref:tetratricopeptide repeat protein n=1 Tax=Schlesneria paludicola TaxID=360056 RepID=UPI000299DE9B|nr:tetratricopeptide repeat protein [Schlesneria paludicola]